MKILGVDEAGRGCVVGPLVIAGVLVEQEDQSKLTELGVKDSKLLSRKKRSQLASVIEEIAVETRLVKLAPKVIDKAVRSTRKLHKLNRLEARAMASIIEDLKPDLAIVDAADVWAQRYGDHIKECLSYPLKVISEHKADSNYPVVSAASIIAKVTRDHDIDELKEEHGDFGSGYVSDPKTKAFIENLARLNKRFPAFIRSSWKTVKTAKRAQSTKQAHLEISTEN